jgi:hypothetical protein
MDSELITGFLEDMGRALGERDLEAIANSWEVPALVLSDEGAVAVADAGEIERFFAQAVD